MREETCNCHQRSSQWLRFSLIPVVKSSFTLYPTYFSGLMIFTKWKDDFIARRDASAVLPHPLGPDSKKDSKFVVSLSLTWFTKSNVVLTISSHLGP